MADTIDQERRAALAKLIEVERWKRRCETLLDDLFLLIAERPGGIPQLEADVGEDIVVALDRIALFTQGKIK